MSTILLILLVLLVVGALPTWPYSNGWGYYPSGGLGLVVVIVLILDCSVGSSGSAPKSQYVYCRLIATEVISISAVAGEIWAKRARTAT